VSETGDAQALRVVYEGRTDGVSHGSWALVNRRLLPRLRAILGDGLEVVAPGGRPERGLPDVWVSHYYPGLERRRAFLPPPEGPRWIPWVAWETGRLPPDWEECWRARGATEVWACSPHARRLILASTALDPARVRAVPYGVDTALFRPEGPRWRVEREGVFRVLYVGGAVLRKGCDVAVRAYCRAFRPDEPTSLTLKLQGAKSFYADAPAIEAPPGRDDFQVLAQDGYTDEQMARLYRTVDVVLQPYRAEGFCLPLLEAMACGVPVVYPAHGPAPAYVPADAGVCVPSVRGEPDAESVARALRWLWRHPEARHAMGAVGREGALGLDWEAVAGRVRTALLLARDRRGSAWDEEGQGEEGQSGGDEVEAGGRRGLPQAPEGGDDEEEDGDPQTEGAGRDVHQRPP
jgi:glycosyltransferase involved in cell wall biosynthesis